jgi:hypothetical protein
LPACCRIHDATRDESAQKAAEAAKKIGNSSLFQKELANLDSLAKLEIDSVFRGETRLSRALVDEIAVSNWAAVDVRIKAFGMELENALASANATIASIDEDLKADRARLDALKKKAPAPAADPKNAADAIAKVASGAVEADAAAGQAAAQLKGKGGQAAGQLMDVVGKALAEADQAAKTVAANQQAVADVRTELGKLATDLTGLSIQRIALEIDGLQTRKDIYQQQVALDKELQHLVSGYQKITAGLDRGEDIVKTIQDAADAARTSSKEGHERLERALGGIFDCAAIAARWNTADLVTRLRLAHLEHQTSIRKSQLEAHAYEVAIGNGAQRLALFYRGGIRPETVAQLITSFSTAAIPWAIKTN